VFIPAQADTGMRGSVGTWLVEGHTDCMHVMAEYIYAYRMFTDKIFVHMHEYLGVLHDSHRLDMWRVLVTPSSARDLLGAQQCSVDDCSVLRRSAVYSRAANVCHGGTAWLL
jgi:hypothetical protein